MNESTSESSNNKIRLDKDNFVYFYDDNSNRWILFIMQDAQDLIVFNRDHPTTAPRLASAAEIDQVFSYNHTLRDLLKVIREYLPHNFLERLSTLQQQSIDTMSPWTKVREFFLDALNKTRTSPQYKNQYIDQQ